MVCAVGPPGCFTGIFHDSGLAKVAGQCVSPRVTLAGLSGPQWTEWLATHSPTPLPQQVGEQLANEIYRDADEPHDVEALRHYATHWIRHHQRKVPTDT